VRWSVALQLELLMVEWPETLLRWPDCAPEQDPANPGSLLWRGLRVRCGMAFGRAQHRKPLNTGAALPGAAPHVQRCHCHVPVLLTWQTIKHALCHIGTRPCMHADMQRNLHPGGCMHGFFAVFPPSRNEVIDACRARGLQRLAA
jgi:hypothetical protein